MNDQDFILKCERFAQATCRQSTIPETLWQHTIYVRDCARQLIKMEQGDGTVVEIAALFHDMGQIVDYSNHHLESCKLAEAFLIDAPLSEPRKQLILKCIAKHRSRFSQEKENEIEVKILQSADMLSRLFDESYFQDILDNSGAAGLEFWYTRTMKKINLPSAFILAQDKIDILRAAIAKAK